MHTRYSRRKWILLMLAPVALGFAGGAGAYEDGDCLACHEDESEVGEAFVIGTAGFETTAHAEVGCQSCHPGVGDGHPLDGTSPERTACGECHAEVEAEMAQSSHAANAGCLDCHDPHAARGTTEVSGHDMNRPCAGCHDTSSMGEAHAGWLPQAELHMEVLPCITCHTGSEDYVITLYFSGPGSPVRGDFEPASYEKLRSLAGEGPLEGLLDSDSDGRIAIQELRRFHLDPAAADLRLQGMLTPRKITHTFQVLENRWDCSFCHSSGPEAMQASVLSLPREDGFYRQVPVEKGAVLDALLGTPDFYMVGATRSRLLDLVGVAILAGGLVMPIGHGTLRFFTRKNRNKGESHD